MTSLDAPPTLPLATDRVELPPIVRRNWFLSMPWSSKLSVLWVAMGVLSAVFADLLPLKGYDAVANAGYRTGPFHVLKEPLGTDRFGRSILSRLVYGGRVSLAVGLTAALIGIVIGGSIGIASGYFRGWLDRIAEVLSDSLLAVPGLVVLLAMRAVWSPSLPLLIVGLGVLSVPTFMRVARANTLAFSEREFVRAAQSLGATNVRVMLREILPNIVLPLLTYGVVVVGGLIVAEGSLSYLGLGIPLPTPSWGVMISQGQPEYREFPHLVFTPAIVLFLTVLSLNTLGDHLRGRLQVKQSNL